MMYTTSTIIPDDEKIVAEDKKTKTIKTVVRFVVGGLVEIFVGAVTNSVVGRVDGSKAAKMGAKAGGFLAGLYLGDKVSDYICGGIDEIKVQLEDLKAAIDEEG